MFCPRCGSSITEALKFCRGCGLPLTQISSYVATGGTANLTTPEQLPQLEYDEYLTPGQKLALAIIIILLSPAILALMSEGFGLPEEVIAADAILMPAGILWAVFHYKAVMRRRRKQAIQAANAVQAIPLVQQPSSGAYAYPPQLSQTNTNPLADISPGSVIEDETRKLREKG